MTKEEAREILQSMIDGVDPNTGEILPATHLCNNPTVKRALHIAIMCMSDNDKFIRKNGQLNAGRPWTKADSANLTFLYRHGATMEEICAKLQRRERGVRNQLEYLGLIENEKTNNKNSFPGMERSGKKWTQNEDALLERMHREKMPIPEIARKLKRSEYSIYCRMERTGLFGEELGYPAEDQNPIFSREYSSKLREMYEAGKTETEIAEYLGCPVSGIQARLFYMGLVKDSPIPHLFPKKK